VATTFTSQLQDLDQHCPDGGKLLQVLAFFDPESIPLEMLITGAKAIAESQQPPTRSPLSASLLALIQCPITRQHAISHLQARCLVMHHSTSESPTFRIHDLIQLIVLESTKNSGLDQELFELAAELACAAFSGIKDVSSPEWWPQCELLIPHIQSLTLRQDTSIKAKKALLLANHLRGWYMSHRGRYAEAESLDKDIIAAREQLFERNDVDTLAVMHHLAWVYSCRGRYVDAEKLFKKVLEGRKSQLGPGDRETLMTMHRLAQVHYCHERYDEAETLFKQTLQGQESQLGLEDNDTLSTKNFLAEVHRSQLRYDEAESLLKRVLETREKLLGSENGHTLSTKHSLANVYLLQQRYDTANELFEEVLRVSKRDLSEQHPDTLTSMYSLACVYVSQGCRYGDAKSLLARVLETRERILGLSHPYTQSAVNVLIQVYENLGQLDDARKLKLKQRIS
jgi:tetratricopeptide (TPR) repeat protein